MFSTGTRILIVDDMKTMRLLLRKSLADLGFTDVTEAGDGDEAWNQAVSALKNETPYGLIISDWIMPKTKGIHLLNRVRSNTAMKKLPFLMLTGENEADSIREAIAAGVTGYLLKPFTIENLRASLESAFKASSGVPAVKKSA